MAASVIFIKGSSGNVADVDGSGQLLTVGGGGGASNISGQTVISQISGQTIIARISGDTITSKVSGETVIARISGQTVLARVSGDTVIARISGETVIARVSGDTIIAKVSGDTIIARVSGQFINSAIFGQSGILNAAVSTPASDSIAPGARGALAINDFLLLYSRDQDAWNRADSPLSGRGVLAVAVEPTTAIITDTEIAVSAASGGSQLPSGKARSVTVKMTQGQTGVMRVGGVGAHAPFSGKGLVLGPGDSYTAAVNNPNAIRVHATVSGEKLSWIATQYS